MAGNAKKRNYPKKRSPGHKIGALQERIMIDLLASGASQHEVAEALNIHPNTVSKRMAQPGFRAKVSDTCGILIEAARGKLVELSTKAIAALGDVLDDATATHSSKISAARSILEYGIKYRESTQVVEKISELEGSIESIKQRAEELTSVAA